MKTLRGNMKIKLQVLKLGWLVPLLLCVGTPLLADLSAGLVAYYPFDGNANDVSGSGNHGTVTGATLTTDRAGSPNSAYAFTGYDDISFAQGPGVNPLGSFTYAFWMVSTLDGNYTAPSPYDHVWFVDRTAETDQVVSLAVLTEPQGQLWFQPLYDDHTNPDPYPGNLVGGMLTPQIWQHIAMVRDYNNGFKLYVNGAMVGSAPDNGKSLTPPALKLGMHAWNGFMGFVGAMDDVRIYNRALLDSEILALSEKDSDGDGVPDVNDQCPNTAAGSVVDAQGCSIAQLVPCDGPLSGGTWKNHGQYVRAVVRTANAFLKAKLITRRQWAQIVTSAARSKCGWNRRWDHDSDRDWRRYWDWDRDGDWGRGRDGDTDRDRGRD